MFSNLAGGSHQLDTMTKLAHIFTNQKGKLNVNCRVSALK